VIDPKQTGATSLAYVTHILTGLREDEYVAYVKRRILASNPNLAQEIERR
jgi:hypothetical protein